MPELADPAAAVEAHACPMCGAPAGSSCRTQSGRTAPKYHTPRFMRVPQLRSELEVRTPADRGPGRDWIQGPAVTTSEQSSPVPPVRVGYARCSSVTQELQSQLDALEAVDCTEIFKEKISTRVKERPQFTAALEFARTIKKAVPHQRVIFTVHEMKRLGRGAAELLATAEDLRLDGIELELLTGPLQGIHNPSGHGGALFAFFAGMAEAEREYIRERTLEGQATARARGRHGGRPAVVDEDMAAYARSLRDKGIPVADIRQKLVIPTGKNKGERPSLATVYRILSGTDETNSNEKNTDSDPRIEMNAARHSLVSGRAAVQQAPAAQSMCQDNTNERPDTPQHHERHTRGKYARYAPTCPSCGVQSGVNYAPAQMTDDLQFVWLKLSEGDTGPITTAIHCARCQPPDRHPIGCTATLCEAGPILGGQLAVAARRAAETPPLVNAWLVDRGWTVDAGLPICPEHSTSGHRGISAVASAT